MKSKHWLLVALFVAGALGISLYFFQKAEEKRRLAASPAERGLMLIENNGCRACHQLGNSFRAPELEKLYGREVSLADGSKTIVDEAYIREAIVDPKAKVSAGYQAVMPTYNGMLSDQEISEIIEYTKLQD